MDYTEYNAGHLTGQPKADDIAIREPETFADDPACASSSPTLTRADIACFKEHGFVVKRGLIDDPSVFAQVADHLWNNVPRGVLRRDDAKTWLAAWNGNGQGEEQRFWRDEDVPRVGRCMHGNWKMRSPGANGIGTEPFLVQGIANHPHMLAIASAFLGGAVKPARRVRGIYAVFPKPPSAPGRLGPHADYMAAQISAMALASDIRARGGGFTLWPGSHRLLHPHWDTVHGGRMSPERGEGFRLARDAVLRDITPLEFTGQAGDVVFWHPRTLHSAGVNDTASDAGGPPAVRLVVPCDYQCAGTSCFDDEEFGPGEKYQWWVDTRNFREDAPTTAENIFNGWAI